VGIPRAILVPVDGSSFAEHALPYGLGIARRTGATLHLALVHVPADTMAPAYPLADVVEARLTEERDREVIYLDRLVERLAPSGVELRRALLHGRVSEALTAYVEEASIDLVAMTTHGRGGFQRAWLGSTTDAMCRECPAPILLIRPSATGGEVDASSDHAFRRVLAALDGSQASERALAGALALGVTAEASVVLAHVVGPPVAAASPYLPDPIQLTQEEVAARTARVQRYLTGVASWAELEDRAVETRIMTDYEPAPAILDLAETVDADLLVLGTHGRGGLRRLILGSVADKVVRGTHRAVFVHRGAGRNAWAERIPDDGSVDEAEAPALP
jgi:nucleotide-binding universal stress UspA family protein